MAIGCVNNDDHDECDENEERVLSKPAVVVVVMANSIGSNLFSFSREPRLFTTP